MTTIHETRLQRFRRLRGRDSFGRLFREGSAVRRGPILVRYRPVERGAVPVVVGFVTGRKLGSAVRRNRARRRMREAYRLERARFESRVPELIGVELLVIWGGTPEGAWRTPFEELRNTLASALDAVVKRLRARNDSPDAPRPSPPVH